jgi:plasmid maintenance system antidote protein VapI
MPNSDRNANFIAVGKLLYGARWQRPVANVLGVPQSTINAIAVGRRAVTAELELKIAGLAEHQISSWRRISSDLGPLVAKLRGQ